METSATPPPPETSAEPSMSLAGRMLNVFATPGDVFEEVKAQPAIVANWLVPLILSCVVGVIASVLIFSQPNVVQQFREQQDKAFDKKIEAGKMTKQQADQVRAVLEKFSGPKFMMISGSISVAIWTPAVLFLIGLVVWLIGTQLFNAQFTYLKAVEVVGLASVISILGTIVRTLLVVAKGNMMMAPSPVLFIQNFDPKNLTHALLSILNFATLWYLAVVSIALQKLGGTSFGKAAACIYGLWALIMIPVALLGAFLQSL